MQKLMISATVMADDNLDISLVQRLMAVLGEVESSSVMCVHYRPIEDRDCRVWVLASTDESEPYLLVAGPCATSGVELDETLTSLLMETGVCTSMTAFYPRADRYGAPSWASCPDGSSAAGIPSMEGFFIASEGFSAVCRDSGDDSAESFWFEIAVREESPFPSMLAMDASDEVKSAIDGLYGEACKRNSTYEAVVHSQFCAAMDALFDSSKPSDRPAFYYARQAYGYQTSEELRKAQEKDWEEGICSHGLDSMTCPCGCFEIDEPEEDEDDADAAKAQEICDRIRRNLTEDEMKTALEGAGFAVHETGHELVDALYQAIEAGDVSESVLDV